MSENTTDPRVKIIEGATHDDIRPGDRFVWEETWTAHGMTFTNRREGIAHRRNNLGLWETADGGWLPSAKGEDITVTIYRAAPELPTEPDAVIERADGHKYITATVDGETYRAREAMLSGERWHAVWRRDSGRGAIGFVRSHEITPGTWKLDDQ